MARLVTPVPAGILVGDQRRDKVLLPQDRDGDENLTLTGNDFGGNSNVLKLTDLNGDGDFLGFGETVVFGSSGYDGQADVTKGTLGAGNHFSVFLDDETNTLYSSGENVVGQLGNGAVGFDVKTPRAVVMPEGFDAKITAVSAGLLHTTVLTDDGDVYAFGFNNRGPLGQGDEQTRTEAVKVMALDDVTVTSIENGNSTSFAITDTGALFAWGTNSNGQLGLGDREERLTPTKVTALEHETVVSVSSGVSFTLALTADGQVYAFGSNTDGQLGAAALNNDGTPQRRALSPVLVQGLPNNVTSVTADTKTSFAVTADGRVFGWGESRYGQLLQGNDNGDGSFAADRADVMAPVELTAIMPDGVVEIKGGARWFAALTQDGDVYVWGPNDQGPSGALDGDPAAESNASFYPTKIAALDHVNVVEIQTGPNSLIVRTDTGQIFSWGSNSDGRLGFASDGSVFIPREVVLDGPADPYLIAANPADNDRDVANDSTLTLTFTEKVTAGAGTITLVNRDTGERLEIDVTDSRLVSFDGDTVKVTPPEHLAVDARYYVEISSGAVVDLDGNAYEGIATGDRSTFNFKTEDTASEVVDGDTTYGDDLIRGGAADDRLRGSWGDDLISGGDGNDRIRGGAGDDDLSGGAGKDRIYGGWGDDTLTGGAGDDRLSGGVGWDTLSGGDGNDRLRGGWGDDSLGGGDGNDLLIGGLGHDVLDGGAGDDTLIGGWGEDTFVFDGGHDTIRDFDPGTDWWFWSIPGDRIVIDRSDVDGFDDLTLTQHGRHAVISFGDNDSLTLRNVHVCELSADMFDFG